MKEGDQKQIDALSQRILKVCAERLGSAAALAKFLGVSEQELADWMDGRNLPPSHVILKAVDPLASKPRQ